MSKIGKGGFYTPDRSGTDLATAVNSAVSTPTLGPNLYSNLGPGTTNVGFDGQVIPYWPSQRGSTYLFQSLGPATTLVRPSPVYAPGPVAVAPLSSNYGGFLPSIPLPR